MADSLQMLCVLLYKYNLYTNSHIDYRINVYIYNRFYENLIHSLDTFIKKNIKISMVLLLNRNNMRKKIRCKIQFQLFLIQLQVLKKAQKKENNNK